MEDNKNFIGSNAKYICMSGVERRMRTKERTRGSGGGGRRREGMRAGVGESMQVRMGVSVSADTQASMSEHTQMPV